MKRFIIGFAILFISLEAWSVASFTLKVGSTGPVEMLDSFPGTYAASRVEISLDQAMVSETDTVLDGFHFIFADRDLPQLATFGSVCFTFTDKNDTEWNVW